MKPKLVINKIQRIEKEGKTKFTAMKSYKNMRTWISSRIQIYSRSGNVEWEFAFREILNAYNTFHPVIREDQIEFKPSKLWKPVMERMESSGAKRYNWNGIFGESLTKKILKIRKKGYDVEQCYALLLREQVLLDFIGEFPHEKIEILDKVKNSVQSRYAENNTADKLKEEEEDSN